MSRFLVITVLCLSTFAIAKDPLPRRPQLGAQLQPIAEDDSLRLAWKFEGGLRLGAITPKTSAEEGGLKTDDILLKLNGLPITDVQELIESLKTIGSNKSVKFDLLREGKALTKSVKLKSYPKETPPDDIEVIHDAVKIDGFLRRVVFTKPKQEGKFPLFVMMGGLGCYSMDPPGPGFKPYMEILHAANRAGFVTLRVEFTGMGDSEGPPCSEQGFFDECHGFTEALKQMHNFAFVDTSRVILFGHSMGGLVAPTVAKEFPVDGIIGFATGGIDWVEYELTNTRRQMELGGTAYDSIETAIKNKSKAMYEFVWEGRSTQELMAEKPEYSDLLQYPVADKFIRDLCIMNSAAEWKDVTAKVLFLYPNSDFITSADDHQYATNVVNFYHPGNAEYQEIEDMDHYLLRVPDQEAAFQNVIEGLPNKEFNSDILPVITDWCKQVLNL
jgi:pimeloyl-ACP methyl ester carboxylesterase